MIRRKLHQIILGDSSIDIVSDKKKKYWGHRTCFWLHKFTTHYIVMITLSDLTPLIFELSTLFWQNFIKINKAKIFRFYFVKFSRNMIKHITFYINIKSRIHE